MYGDMDEEINENLLGGQRVRIRRSNRMGKMMEFLPYPLLFVFLASFVLGVRYSADSDQNERGDSSNEVSNSSWTYECKNSQCQRLGGGNNETATLETWTYECKNSQCQRLRGRNNEITTLETCNMLCAVPSLWPKPKSIRSNKKTASTFNLNQMSATFNVPSAIKTDLEAAFDIFKQKLPFPEYSQLESADAKIFQVEITLSSGKKILKLSTKESYSLSVYFSSNKSITANISAPTYFGARHALETLGQLIWLDTSTNKLNILHDIEIEDAPTFPYRGVMVDTARNFFTISSLFKVVDGMSASKLNVLHLHLTDAVSFPVVLPSIPELSTYGAYGPNMIYTPEDIRGLIEYARIRGIRTILEVDSPSHVNEGWNSFNNVNDKVIICGEKNVIGGQLNPDNPKTLKLLRSVYKDLLELGTDKEIFHVGGDEVDLGCYAKTESSKNFPNIYEFWANFSNDIFEIVVSADADNPPKNMVIWSSPLTDYHLNSLKYSGNLVVQYWFGQLHPIVENKNRIIFSTVGKWYLDCGFGPWQPDKLHGSCDPYTPWQTFYKYRPWRENNIPKDQVLGGEACLWSEEVDESDLETRLWPRAAAFAERVWSDPVIFDSYDVSTRLSIHRNRLIGRGLKVAAIWPLWCTKNPGKC